MSENRGEQGPEQKKRGQNISRRRFLGGAVVVGGLVLLGYLFRDKIKNWFAPGGGGTTTATGTAPGTTTTGTTTTAGTTTVTTTGTTVTTTTPPTTTTSTPATLVAPEMPSEMLRPYLTIKTSAITRGSGGSPDILDVFLVNSGYGAALAFFDVYQWIAPTGTGTPTVASGSRGGGGVLAAESEIFPLTFPGSRCLFLSREMLALPPGAAIARSIYIDPSQDGIWGILYDPILDPARFTILNAEFFATDDGRRKYVYCGV